MLMVSRARLPTRAGISSSQLFFFSPFFSQVQNWDAWCSLPRGTWLPAALRDPQALGDTCPCPLASVALRPQGWLFLQKTAVCPIPPPSAGGSVLTIPRLRGEASEMMQMDFCQNIFRGNKNSSWTRIYFSSREGGLVMTVFCRCCQSRAGTWKCSVPPCFSGENELVSHNGRKSAAGSQKGFSGWAGSGEAEALSDPSPSSTTS